MAPTIEVDTLVEYVDESAEGLLLDGQQQQQHSKDIDEETSSTTSSEETLGSVLEEEDSGFNSSEEDAEEKKMLLLKRLQKSDVPEEIMKGVGGLPRNLAATLQSRLRETTPKRLETDASASVVEPPFSLKLTVYLSYAVLILFGYIRIFLERCGVISKGMCKEKNREVSLLSNILQNKNLTFFSRATYPFTRAGNPFLLSTSTVVSQTSLVALLQEILVVSFVS